MPNLMHFPVEVPTFDRPDPMDPRQSNRKRALRCAVGLVAYWGYDGEGEDALTVAKDFLTDLLHWGDGQGIDIEDLLASARRTYEEEGRL
jgi:hypothetical protein